MMPFERLLALLPVVAAALAPAPGLADDVGTGKIVEATVPRSAW